MINSVKVFHISDRLQLFIYLICCFSPPDVRVQEASVFHRPAQPVSWRRPALPEGLPAVGGALPGHRPQLHLRLRPGAERRRRLSGPRRSARRHAQRAAPVSHQENQQVLLPGPDQRRGPRVRSVTEAETRRPQGDRFSLLRVRCGDVSALRERDGRGALERWFLFLAADE